MTTEWHVVIGETVQATRYVSAMHRNSELPQVSACTFAREPPEGALRLEGFSLELAVTPDCDVRKWIDAARTNGKFVKVFLTSRVPLPAADFLGPTVHHLGKEPLQAVTGGIRRAVTQSGALAESLSRNNGQYTIANVMDSTPDWVKISEAVLLHGDAVDGFVVINRPQLWDVVRVILRKPESGTAAVALGRRLLALEKVRGVVITSPAPVPGIDRAHDAGPDKPADNESLNKLASSSPV